jgi:hypothetical protein
MDRRYYGLKALIVAAALSVTIIGGGFECSRFVLSHNPDFEAAFVAQNAIQSAGVKIGRSLGHFFSRAFADL